ncbi:MAG: glycosyltransferase [Candidatus Omnitrophica bacterium]|nr:glycosyltransferase [Candidatus Omnitrophota bacterium]
MKPLNIHIINNSHVSKQDMSGGEKIALEFARRCSEKNNIILYSSNLGIHIWDKYEMTKIKKLCLMTFKKCSNVFSYFFRAMVGAFKLSKVKLDKNHENIIYSASDFWPDSIPGFCMKLSNKNMKWVAGFYLFAPLPWQKDSPYKGKRWIVGLFYWITQIPIYWIIKKNADMVFVTSQPDVNKFITKTRGVDKIVVIRGGVDIEPSEKYLNSGKNIAVGERKYDACFLGRFHPQKGIFELIDICKLVCEKRPEFKLAMIGNGPLENEAKEKIKKLNLENNIDLLGFKDGEEKYKIFKQSKIVVHPAIYDSGGMAAAEAMAWGIPGVSFDLEALKTYYPYGMIKVLWNDFDAFSEEIIRLLDDSVYYARVSSQARDLIVKEWSWDNRADLIYAKMLSLSKLAKAE